MIFYLLAIIVVVIDQASKYWIRTHLNLGETLDWSCLVQFTHIENTGIAGSQLEGYGKYFSIVAVIFVGYILYQRKISGVRGVGIDLATGFLVGGAVGNAIDRIWFGRVTDFLEFRSGHGVMNVADIALNVGVILYFVQMIIHEVVKRRKSLS